MSKSLIERISSDKILEICKKVNTYNIDNPGYTDELYIMDGVRYKRGEKGKLIKI